MSGLFTTGSAPKRLLPGVEGWFGNTYNQYPQEYKEIFETMSSSKNYEEIVGLVGMGLAVPKEQGGPVEYASPRQGFTSRFVHVNYGIGFVITQEALDDDQYAMSMAKMGAEKLAWSMNQTKETIAANVLNNATSGSYLGGDGVALLSTSHPLYGASGGTFSNKLSTDADFSEASFEQALIDIGGFVDDAGMKIAVLGQKLHIPRQIEFNVRRVLMSELRVGTADNDINASKGRLPGGYGVNHYLTDANAWFITTNCPYGMIHFERSPYAITSDNDFDTDNAKFKVQERYSFGWADPRGIYGTTGG
jgi:hypothetical protein